MTQYECGYCSYKGEKQPMRGHLLSKHDINGFQEPIWRHAEEVSPDDSGDQTLQQFMDEEEEVINREDIPSSKSRLKKVAESIRNLFN